MSNLHLTINDWMLVTVVALKQSNSTIIAQSSVGLWSFKASLKVLWPESFFLLRHLRSEQSRPVVLVHL